jgi:hypothetical protein
MVSEANARFVQKGPKGGSHELLEPAIQFEIGGS